MINKQFFPISRYVLFRSKSVFPRRSLRPYATSVDKRTADGTTVHSESNQAVKLAYTSYESTKPSLNAEWPIIIMHGLFGSKANWNSLSKALHTRTQRKIYAIDARNHGDSPHTAEMTYYHLAEDIISLMKDLEIKKACMIGHSMGGRCMMLLALKYPEFVERLLVVDISPLQTTPVSRGMVKYIEAMKNLKLDGIATLSAARKAADSQLLSTIHDPAIRQFLLTNLVDVGDGTFKWRINLDSISKNFDNLANFPNLGKTFLGPTFFIAGGKSDYIRIDEHTDIRRIFPEAKFATVSDAGHWVHAEKPNEFLQLTTEFLR